MQGLYALMVVLLVLHGGESYPVTHLLPSIDVIAGNRDITQGQTTYLNSTMSFANNDTSQYVQNKRALTTEETKEAEEVEVPGVQNKISLNMFSIIGSLLQAIFGFGESAMVKKALAKIVPILNDSQTQIQAQYPQQYFKSLTVAQVVNNLITAQDLINEKRKQFEALRSQSSLY